MNIIQQSLKQTLKTSTRICFINATIQNLVKPVLYSSTKSSESTGPSSNLENNPYFQRYSKKIVELKQSEPLEYEQRLKSIENKKKKLETPLFTPCQCPEGKHSRPTLKRPPSQTKEKKLNDILKVDLIQNLTAKEISQLWKENFAGKDGIWAVIPNELYDKMYSLAEECPIFVYPLIRGPGYEFMIGQFSAHNCYFTSLANFKAHKEDAPVCLTITHFPELQDTKKIVLMRGEFDDNVLSSAEAQFLASQVQIYYTSDNERKKNILWTFNKNPEQFKHTDVIKELEHF